MIDIQAAWQEVLATATTPPNLLEWAEQQDDKATLAAACSIAGVCAALTFEPETALAHSRAAIDLYGEIELSSASEREQQLHVQFQWSALNNVAKIVGQLGAGDEAVDVHREALALAESARYDRGILISQFNLCIHLLRLGRATEATFEVLHGRIEHHPELAESFEPLRHEALAYI